MTIAISTKIGEGLVYATDSTTTMFETFDTASRKESRLAQSFHHARKLMQLEAYPVGIMTYGLGHIAARNLESLVAEFERNVLTPSYAVTPHPFTIEGFANQLHQFLAAKYDAVHPPPTPAQPGDPVPADERIGLGVVIGGFSTGEFYPDEWGFVLPYSPPARVRHNQTSDFGVRWWGVTDPLMRLIGGVDPRLQQWLIDQGIDRPEAQRIYLDLIGQFSWPIVFDGMPVQDAVDLSVFLANVTIGHSRFVVGPPVCGGPVDVAAITHNGFSWVRQKKAEMKGDSVFF